MNFPRTIGVWHSMAGVCILAFAATLLALGPKDTFLLWGFKVNSPDFEDARGITAALESQREGHQPWVDNPRDPWGRLFNYPRVWLQLGKLGVDQSHTAVLAAAMTVLFFLGALLFPPRDTAWLTSVLMLAVLFSPAVMLGIQNGNIDQLMFFLLAIAIAGISSNRSWARALGVGAVLAGMSLKIFPIFGAAAVLGWDRRRCLRTLAFIGAVAGLYLATHWQEIAAIRHATPMASTTSYGRDVLWMRLQQESATAGGVARVCSWLGVAAAFALVPLGFRAGNSKKQDEGRCARQALAAFHVGAGVYCGTFLLGNNWDYRLMFLVFTFPLLAGLARHGEKLPRIVSVLALVASLLSCWHIAIWKLARHVPFGSPSSVALDETCNWLVFLCLMFLGGHGLRSGPLASRTPPPPVLSFKDS